MRNSSISISSHIIDDNNPCFIIAEACDNHLGSIDIAKKMIDASHSAGANAIKFQHHLPDEEMLRDIPMSDNFDEPLYEFLRKYALTLSQHRELKEYCDKVGILYMCTPFSYAAAKDISDLVSVFKIGSGEMTDLPSIEAISDIGLPMILSTGMSTFEEIDRTYNFLENKHQSFALLNCLSEYPPVYEDLNLGVITSMRERYLKAVIGHSDHTPDIYTSFAAVTLGAKIIEKHVILDKNQPGPDQSVSIEFNQLKNLVTGIRQIEVSLGKDKIIHKKEEEIRAWAFRSLVSIKDIAKGEIISKQNIWCKRPGTGIPSSKMNEVLGLYSSRKIPANTLLSWEDFTIK